MTKCIVLGNKPSKRKLKPIEFIGLIEETLNLETSTNLKPKDYKNIELICTNYTSDNLDLMFAYDEDRNDPLSALWLGYWNDGIV